MIERRSWRFSDGMLLMGLAALAVVACWPVWIQIINTAIGDVEQSHILLAPVIVAWLVWVRRDRFRMCRPSWSPLGPLAVVAGWLLINQGFRGGWDLFEHTGALLVLVGAILTVTGPEFFIKFAPAIVGMGFFLPIPGRIRHVIALQLQESSAQITHGMLELFGAPIELAGNVLTVNGQDVAVAEACNGMRMIAALALVSYAFVFSTPMRNWARILILAVSPAVALVCNVIRLTPTVLFYGYASPDTAELFHDVSGWAMLFVALGILWAMLGLMRWLELPVDPLAVGQE
jgi:exosortase